MAREPAAKSLPAPQGELELDMAARRDRLNERLKSEPVHEDEGEWWNSIVSRLRRLTLFDDSSKPSDHGDHNQLRTAPPKGHVDGIGEQARKVAATGGTPEQRTDNGKS